MERIVAAVIGAFVGAFLKHFYDRRADRSEPLGSILRIGLTTTVPKAAREVVASFPEALALRYNTSPVLPASIDAAKQVPLEYYAKQVHEIREAVRVQLGIQERGLHVIDSLFKGLDRNDPTAFAKLFAENDSFLWSWIRGRTLRGHTPPEAPPDVIEVSSIQPRPGLHVRTDKDDDYLIDISGDVRLILLTWSTKKAIPETAKLCRQVASGVARSIAEFRADELRTLLAAVESDVKAVVDDLRALLADVSTEERRYSFLEVAALMRNRGRRAYAADSVARLFVEARGYTFAPAGGTPPVTLSDDLDVELLGEGSSTGSEFVVVKPGEASVIRFLTKLPFAGLASREALESLGRHGERTCRLGVRLFREGVGPELYYAPATSFRMFEAGTSIPSPRDQTERSAK